MNRTFLHSYVTFDVLYRFKSLLLFAEALHYEFSWRYKFCHCFACEINLMKHSQRIHENWNNHTRVYYIYTSILTSVTFHAMHY